MFKKNRILWIILAIAIALAVYFLVIKQKSPDSEDASAETLKAQVSNTNAALTVNTVKIKRTMLNLTIPANGNIAAWQEAVVGAEVNGLLLNEVLVNVGDSVKRGQILARFASDTISADLAQASANLAEAKAAAIEAAGNASRAKSIQNSGALSTQQIEQYLSAEASTKARVEAAEATLNLQNIKLKQTTVNAPDDGIISSRTATVGSVAAAGQELFKLVRKGRLEWRAELTSADINKIHIGMKTDLTLPDGHILTGKVRAIAPSIDSQTRNALVYVDIPADTAKAGMYARGVFVLENTEAYTLPADAIVLRDGFAYAMQVIAKPVDKNSPAQTDGLNPIAQIKQIKVNTGRRSGDLVELLDVEDQTLKNNFVASGGAFLADGDTVRVVPKNERVSTESVAR
ncbi:efflux RND transporter periplasmic adaptor subunit [Methylotenera versatilis]|uniref:efflux RND transporter periplasmic adaptor subunit n=1 Tax=Methylotenera versatilis TaxID=1055487 RepID=UPI00064720E4|nr:efflux RND transporter periplasmic adaptor subunit [Methylotenera versatilis]